MHLADIASSPSGTLPPPPHDTWRELDIDWIRSQFDFASAGRIVTNNAASTQAPRAVLDLTSEVLCEYENVHRGQSQASQATTLRFECAYDTIAAWINAPSRRNIVTCRNTTEAHNTVMYALMTEFRDGDNVVTTMLEHNSNYVPWYALANEILPRFGRRVECRLARFDPGTGALDLDHLASLVDEQTKLVCCTGASNFFGTKPPLEAVRAIANASGYVQPTGERRSLLLVDAAQLVPSTYVDVQALDVDYLSFSFHKLLAPYGVGALYGKEHLLEHSLPFLYGGDMIADGQVSPDHVGYNRLPWKYAAGTPNIVGVIQSAQTLRLTIDLTADAGEVPYFRTERPIPTHVVRQSMDRIGCHTQALTERAMDQLSSIPGITIYGPPVGVGRSPLVAFNVEGWNPLDLAIELDKLGVEARAGCHCATLAHHSLGLDPPASCRISFALYNSTDDIDHASAAVDQATRRQVASRARPQSRR